MWLMPWASDFFSIATKIGKLHALTLVTYLVIIVPTTPRHCNYTIKDTKTSTSLAYCWVSKLTSYSSVSRYLQIVSSLILTMSLLLSLHLFFSDFFFFQISNIISCKFICFFRFSLRNRYPAFKRWHATCGFDAKALTEVQNSTCLFSFGATS